MRSATRWITLTQQSLRTNDFGVLSFDDLKFSRLADAPSSGAESQRSACAPRLALTPSNTVEQPLLVSRRTPNSNEMPCSLGNPPLGRQGKARRGELCNSHRAGVPKSIRWSGPGLGNADRTCRQLEHHCVISAELPLFLPVDGARDALPNDVEGRCRLSITLAQVSGNRANGFQP